MRSCPILRCYLGADCAGGTRNWPRVIFCQKNNAHGDEKIPQSVDPLCAALPYLVLNAKSQRGCGITIRTGVIDQDRL